MCVCVCANCVHTCVCVCVCVCIVCRPATCSHSISSCWDHSRCAGVCIGHMRISSYTKVHRDILECILIKVYESTL